MQNDGRALVQEHPSVSAGSSHFGHSDRVTATMNSRIQLGAVRPCHCPDEPTEHGRRCGAMKDPRDAAARWASTRRGQGPAYLVSMLTLAVIVGVVIGAATGFWAAVVLVPVAALVVVFLFLVVMSL